MSLKTRFFTMSQVTAGMEEKGFSATRQTMCLPTSASDAKAMNEATAPVLFHVR